MENSNCTLYTSLPGHSLREEAGPGPGRAAVNLFGVMACANCNVEIENEAADPFKCSSLGFFVVKKAERRKPRDSFSRANSRAAPESPQYIKLCCKCFNKNVKHQHDAVKPCRYCNLGKKTVVHQNAVAQELKQDALFEANFINSSINATGSVMNPRVGNSRASTTVAGPMRCQCRVEIKFKSKDEFHCSSLGYVDDSVDLLLSSSATALDATSRGSLLGAGGPKSVLPKYRRVCCNCFNDRNSRVEMEPQRAKFVQSCAQCVSRKDSAGNASL
jgi:hypothetical protein